MPKYIDADALRKRMEQIAEESKPAATARPMREDTPSELLRYGTARAMIEWLDDIPAADVEPVRHGHYIGTEFDGYADGNPVYYEWKCSECDCVFEDDEPKYRYCPNCGAKMDAEPPKEADNGV